MDFWEEAAEDGKRKKVGEKNLKRTKVRFMPDSKIFKESVQFDPAALAQGLERLWLLHASRKTVLKREREGEVAKLARPLRHSGGAAEYVAAPSIGKVHLHENPTTVAFTAEKNITEAEMAHS